MITLRKQSILSLYNDNNISCHWRRSYCGNKIYYHYNYVVNENNIVNENIIVDENNIISENNGASENNIISENNVSINVYYLMHII